MTVTRITKLIFLGGALLMLIGCSSQMYNYSKPGLRNDEFKRDKYVCVQQSQQSWSAGGSGAAGGLMIMAAQADANNRQQALFNMCMEARGYTVSAVTEAEPAERVADPVLSTDSGVRLNVAAMEGNEDAVLDLLNKGVNINTRGYNNVTPLMFAAKNGHAKVVNILLEKGADINAKDTDGKTAVMYASEKGHTNIVKLFDK